jgi:hypothetical protein
MWKWLGFLEGEAWPYEVHVQGSQRAIGEGEAVCK